MSSRLCLFHVSCEHCRPYRRPRTTGGHLTPAGQTWRGPGLDFQLSACLAARHVKSTSWGQISSMARREAKRVPVIQSLPPSLGLQAVAQRRAIKSLISIELDCRRHLALSRLHDKQKHLGFPHLNNCLLFSKFYDVHSQESWVSQNYLIAYEIFLLNWFFPEKTGMSNDDDSNGGNQLHNRDQETLRRRHTDYFIARNVFHWWLHKNILSRIITVLANKRDNVNVGSLWCRRL